MISIKILKIYEKDYPENLRKINKPPQKLYVEGDVSNLKEMGIAVVGSRKCSQYGIRMCETFTKKLVDYNINIISGLAIGIDAVAHKTAIENIGKTIAVLPSGLNKIYPNENKELYNKILKSGGTVITEYSPNTEADSEKFRQRNRIVSGLAIGTLVVEGGYRSGTRVTARLTKKQNKPVFCIPNSLENKNNYSTNYLIKNGAILVTNETDILNSFKDINFIKRKLPKEENIQKNSNKSNKSFVKNYISKEYIELYNIFSNVPMEINQIYNKTKESISEINYKLMMMEIEGYIKELPGRRYIRNE